MGSPVKTVFNELNDYSIKFEGLMSKCLTLNLELMEVDPADGELIFYSLDYPIVDKGYFECDSLKDCIQYFHDEFFKQTGRELESVDCKVTFCDILIETNEIFLQKVPVSNPRKNISQRVRVQVLDRDNSTCQLCGASIKDGVKLHVDHIIPISKGGSNDLDNLQTLCEHCNRGKGDFTDLNMVKNKLRGD